MDRLVFGIKRIRYDFGYDTKKIDYFIKLRKGGFKKKYCIKSVELMGSPGWPFTEEILDGIIEKKETLLKNEVWLGVVKKGQKLGTS